MLATVSPFRRLKRFRTRLLIYIIGLLLMMLTGVLVIVDQVYRQNTEQTIRHELQVSERVFLRLLEERGRQLSQQAAVLASDYAFKSVVATQDQATVTSALSNLSARIRADAAFLVSTEHAVMIDSLAEQQPGQTFFAEDLLAQAEEQGVATRLMLIRQTPYQLIVVPVLAPEPIAWLVFGFAVDNAVLAQLKQLTQVEISLLSVDTKGLRVQASTLADFAQRQLPMFQTHPDGFFWRNDKDVYLSRLVVLERQATGELAALIERSWPKALENFYRLQWLLLGIALLSIILACIAAVWLAKMVSQPVQTLARGVEAIGRGDYRHQVQIDGQDEIGQLGMAFNSMGVQLLEKEKIRTLLGKVVAPAVVQELLNNDVALGGETREITALFTDLAGFTSIAERMSPEALVALLNDYLTHMSDAISAHSGVLDKFIGDAIVAFWGAPVANANHAQQAVYCALAMQRILQQLRNDWQQRGLPLLSMRIGINSGLAVVGNIGSSDRLDYTMIGDMVNLAARLEGANKYYGSGILVSEYTHQRIDGLFVCRELDKVRVQGKRQAVAIYEVLAISGQATPQQQRLCDDFANALLLFRQRQFATARVLFTELSQSRQDAASTLYLQRLAALEQGGGMGFDWVYDLAK